MTRPAAPDPASEAAPRAAADRAVAGPARRGRPSKARSAGAGVARDAILDAAEDLFSKHGFYGVTIREVAREAGVDTALVHYYFGAKRALFDSVFLRRAEIWNNERADAINRYAREAGDAMTLEGLLEAFLRPPFQWSLKGGPGWKHYSRDVDVYWAWHNLSGALTLTLGETGRLDRLSDGMCRSGDLESACAYMVRFASAGFRAVCAPRPDPAAG